MNNRKLIDALLESCGITQEARQKHVLRVVDKLAKVGLDNVRLELGPGRVDESGDPIRGVKLDDGTIGRVLAFIGVTGASRSEVVNNLAAALPESRLAATALSEMRELAEALAALGVDEEHAVFAPSLARGLDYYTGPVFEMMIPDAPQFGSVMGGGRYDGLVSRFMDRPIPCTGMSVGLDRLLAALTHLKQLPEARTTVEVLVVTMGKVPKSESLRVASELRAAGIRTEVYLAKKKKMGMTDQLSHADRHGIPVAVILGEDELANGEVSVKDLGAGKTERADIDDRQEYLAAGKRGQVTVKRAEMLTTVREILETG